MAYGLPARGQADWDDELNNSIESLRGSTQTAEANSVVARSTAHYAWERVRDLAETIQDGIAVPLTEDPGDPGTFLILSQAFITEDANDPGTFLIGA